MWKETGKSPTQTFKVYLHVLKELHTMFHLIQSNERCLMCVYAENGFQAISNFCIFESAEHMS